MFQMTMAADNLGISLSDSEFREFRDIVRQTAGIHLSEAKKALVVSRLAKRLRELGIQSFSNYIQRLKRDDGELMFMTNRITTNLTRFYREKGQFEILRQIVLPHILEEKKKSGNPVVRIWSAGCSSGEEVYSILFETLTYFGGRPPTGMDFKILGSDIDTNVLEKARNAEYTEEEIAVVDPHIRESFFQASPGGLVIREKYRSYVLFSRINLVYDEFRFKNPIDIVFCRNVAIYFDRETKNALYHKFHHILGTPGYLFSGHSESLFHYGGLFGFIKKSVYKKSE